MNDDKKEGECPVKDCKLINTEDQCKNCPNLKLDENYPFIGVTWS